MSKKITALHERGDDIPAIIVHLKNMRVAAFLDNHFLPHGHWQGVRLGQTTVVWLAFLLSEGDQRLSRVAPWTKAHQRTLRRCLGSEVKPRDRAADRFATTRDSLAVAARWGAFACALTQSVLRVDDWQRRMVRIDTTTAGADVTPEGLFQRGHSKDPRPDVPQGNIARAVLDPLGVPLTTTGVAGQTADAPLALPAMAKGRQTAQRAGLPSVGDGKMAARGTRAEIVARQASSLCPLSATQMPDAARDRLLAPVFSGTLIPQDMRLPNAEGQSDATDAPGAIGCIDTLAQHGQEQHKQMQHWKAHRLGGRARACAASQEKPLRQRVARAVTESNAWDARQQGKPRVPDAATACQAAATSLATQRVEGLGHVTVRTDVLHRATRRDGTRPATTVRRARVRGGAPGAEEPRAQAVRRLGWRVSATTHAAEEVSVAQGVAASRSASLMAHGFGRLHGRPLSLSPLLLPDEQRVVALICLWSIARRVLVLRQGVVRRHLRHGRALLTGIDPGPPGRQTAPPTTDMLRWALRDVTLSRLTIDGQRLSHLTPLHAGQKRLLVLMEGPFEISTGLVT